MGAFDDITSQYGKTQNQGNAFEDITSTYGYEVGNAPQPTFIDGLKDGVMNTVSSVGNQAYTTASNMADTVSNWFDDAKAATSASMDARKKSISNSVDAYMRGEIDATEMEEDGFNENYQTPDYQEKSQHAYNTVIGRPAGYLAITPYTPTPVKVAAGILAAPTIVGDAVDMYTANKEAYDAGDTGGLVANSPALTTAKSFLLDPITNPVGRAIDNPGEFVQNIVDNPFNAWEDVFLPAGMVHGVTPKGVTRGAHEMASRAADMVKEKANNAFSDIGERFGKDVEPIREGVQYYASENTPIDEITPKEYSEPTLDGQPFDGETGNIQSDIYNRYRQHGLSDVEAAAMTGNIGAESNFSTTITSGDGYGSRGLIQFTGDRLNGENGLLKFAENNGLDPWDWRTQIDFSVWELHNTENAALRAMRERPDATPAEMAKIVRETYERPDPAVARDHVRAEIAEDTFNGNYGKYENGPRDVSFKENDLRVRDEEPFREEFIENEPLKEQSNKDLNSFIENDTKKVVKSDDLGIKYREATETGHTGDINELQSENRMNTEFAEGEKPVKRENVFKDDVSSQFRYEEDTPNVSLKQAIDDLPLKARETIVQELKDVVKNDAAEMRVQELETKVQTNTDLLQDLNKATKPDLPKVEIDTLKNKIAEKLDVPVETLTTDFMENVKRDRASELIKDKQELKVAEPVERGGASEYAQEPSRLIDKATHEQVRDAVIKAFDGNQEMALRYLESKGVRDGEGIKPMRRSVSRREILDAVNTLFNQRVKSGRLGKPGVRGWFNTKTDVIRTGAFGDIPAIMHELGHYVDSYHGFSADIKFQREFATQVNKRFGNSYEKLNAAGIRGEGYAEFFRDYVSDRAKAKREFPEFYKHFTETIQKNKELNGAVNKLSQLVHEWQKQSSTDRIKGSISFEGKSKVQKAIDAVKRGEVKDVIKKAIDDVYTKMVDELNPLKLLVDEIETVTGEKISFKDNPYMQAWLARGWVGKAEAALEHGDPKKGIKAFKDIIEPITEKEHKEFSAFLVAMHDLDLHHNGQKATFSLAEDVATFKRLVSNEKFVKVSHEIYKYQDRLLGMLVDEGMLSKEAYYTMKHKYPHYVPFFRDLSDVGMQSFLSGGKGFISVSSPIKRLKGSTRDIIDPLESIVKNTFQFYNAVERNHVGRTFAKLANKDGVGRIVEQVEGTARTTDNTFHVWEKGEKITYETTPELIEAMRMLDKEQSNMIMKILSYPASWLRAGATLSPEFILRNPVRDMVGASIFSKHGFIPIVDTFKGLSLFLKKGDLYWEYVKSGAAHAAMVSLDRDYLGGQIRDVMKRESKYTKYIKNPIELLRVMSEATEMATRLAEYDNARKGYTGVKNRLFGTERKPLSPQEAALESRDITLDFSRRGTNTKKANQVIAFFNATIQGADKLARAFREDPRGMTVKTALYITLPSVMLYMMNKDDERYQEIPQWEKDTFWIVPGKDTMYRIPKPFEAGVLFGTSFERMMAYFDDKKEGKNGVGFKGFGDRVIESLAPSFMPTAMIPAVEAMTNYSLFRQRNIIPQSQENLPARLQYGANSSEVAKFIGDKINVSPYIVDNTIRGYGGGLAGLGLSGIDAISGAKENKSAQKWYEAPGVRGFTIAPFQSSDSVQRVYDDYKEQEKLHNEYKLTGQRPENFDAGQYAKLKNAQDSLRSLNKASKAIINNDRLSGEQKRDQLDKINVRKANIARSVYGLHKIR